MGLLDPVPELWTPLPADGVMIHLGDICIGDDQRVHDEYIKTLDCKKWLIKGNHDNKSDTWYLNNGWYFVADAIHLRIIGVQTVLSHIPLPDLGFGINIHGHFHNADHRRHEPELRALYTDRHHLLAVEHTEYQAVNAEKWIRQNVLSKKM